MNNEKSGILLINKAEGYTSRKVGNMLARQLNIKKVGHLGTLDPFATGLLIFALGEGTKVLPFLEDDPKTYVATLQFGLLTTTLDPDGKVLKDESVEPFTNAEIEKVITRFTGQITQIPPTTSAIKIDGKRAYEYARRNVEVVMPKREVEVFSLKVLAYSHPELVIAATVSKGTYIRTLGQDIAQALGTNATTIKLVRTAHGDFKLDNAKRIEDVTLADMISPSKALSRFPFYRVSDEEVKKVRNGMTIKLDASEEIVQIHDMNGVLQALYKKKGDNYIPLRGFNL
ncbi:MAG: tRNA pseudouridine synthase B [Tenericutes bacterium ADurb.Bin087]|nr:MAG: tRNA pseudouridine synthase B [Tenericutes bacterium ADurb.Bin087]